MLKIRIIRTSCPGTPVLPLPRVRPLHPGISLKTGSLKEHCIRWNDADSMDTADSRSKKLAEASATGDPSDILAAKPIPIACELLSLQQRLHRLADAINVSLFYIYTYPQSPKMLAVRDTNIRDFPILF
jgi:hypothetical protein